MITECLSLIGGTLSLYLCQSKSTMFRARAISVAMVANLAKHMVSNTGVKQKSCA